MKWYLIALQNYSDFTGRARRTEYWMFVLFNFLFSILAFVIDAFLEYYIEIFGLVFMTYSLVMIIPSLSLSVRRLHDTGNSGWMYFINLIPLIGGIWFLVLCLTDSDFDTNKWGPNPKKMQDF